MYNPVDVDLMRLEHDRRREELTRPATASRGRRPVVPGRLGPVLAVLLHRDPPPRRRPA